MTKKTTSEIFFEHFCTQHGVRWEPIATEAAAVAGCAANGFIINLIPGTLAAGNLVSDI